MKAYERLLKYAVIKTPSDESSDSTPSSACQFDLANLLKKEMEELVVSNIQLTDNCLGIKNGVFIDGRICISHGNNSCHDNCTKYKNRNSCKNRTLNALKASWKPYISVFPIHRHSPCLLHLLRSNFLQTEISLPDQAKRKSHVYL